MSVLSVLPSLENQYETLKDALEDWDSNKQFRVFPGGMLLCKRDLASANKLYKEGWFIIPNLSIKLQMWG